MSDRSGVDWLTRGQRLRTARILAGVAVALFGVLAFVTPSSGTPYGNSDSALVTLCSVLLVAGGFVLIVGPEKINEIAQRNRRR
jgi:drug/metabolite transporter (DMT)-like permease